MECETCHESLAPGVLVCPNCATLRSNDACPRPESSSERAARSQPAGWTESKRSFGDYESLDKIAQGGMGVVFKARQKGLNRAVALKMILAGEFADENAIRRFQAEAEAAANLQHPNIVPIYEVGAVEGQYFYAMAYVEGPTLASILAQGPVPAERAVDWMRQMAAAIHYAHQRGILHRDLKPSNILVDSATAQPRLTDFGLAKQISKESSLTMSGAILGTPGYMPPEQAAGEGRQANPASDVYSLGAIFFHMLAGQPPFTGESAMDVLWKARYQEAPRLRAINPAIAADLETICLKCLEKSPTNRYASAHDLLTDLDRFVAREPIQAQPVTRVRRAWHWVLRRPWMVSGIFSMATIALVALVYGLWQRALKLEWLLAHPGEKLPRRHLFIDSATLAGLFVYLFMLAGLLPLAALRERRLRQKPLSTKALVSFLALGALQAGFGGYLIMQWIEGYVWEATHYWAGPWTALAPPLALVWCGALVVWNVLVEQFSAYYGGQSLDEYPSASWKIAPGAAGRGFVAATLLILEGALLLDRHWYYKLLFAGFVFSGAGFLVAASVWGKISGLLRPFWPFLLLVLGSFSLEYFTRLKALSLKVALAGLGLALLAGAIMHWSISRKEEAKAPGMGKAIETADGAD